MKRLGAWAALTALAFLVAACSQPASNEAEDAALNGDETAVEEMTPAAADDLAGGRQAAACVIDVPEGSICTMDINACGNSSVCNCGEGYVYDAASGKCLLDLEGRGVATQVSMDDGECVKAPAGMCTRDINVCGQPSHCSCDEGFVWNPVAGKCLKDLTQ